MLRIDINPYRIIESVLWWWKVLELSQGTFTKYIHCFPAMHTIMIIMNDISIHDYSIVQSLTIETEGYQCYVSNINVRPARNNRSDATMY